MIRRTSLLRQILFLLVAAFLASCHRREASEEALKCIDRQLERHLQWEPIELDSTFTDAVVDIERHGTPNQRLLAYYLLGYAYFEHGQIEDAQKAYLHAIASADTTDADCDFSRLAKTYSQKASIYTDRVDPQLRFDNIEQADHCAHLANDSMLIANIYGQKALCYERLNRNADALTNYLYEYSAYLAIGNTSFAAGIAKNIATCYLEFEQLDSVAYYLQRFEEYHVDCDTLVQPLRYVDYYLTKGILCMKRRQIEQAFYYYNKAKEHPRIETQIEAHYFLAGLYDLLGNHNAARYYSNRYVELSDSLNKLNNCQHLQYMQVRFNFDQVQKIANKTSRHFVWLPMLLVALSTIVVIIIYKGKRRVTQDLTSLQRVHDEMRQKVEKWESDKIKADKAKRARATSSNNARHKFSQAVATFRSTPLCARLAKASEQGRRMDHELTEALCTYMQEQFPLHYSLLTNKVDSDKHRYLAMLSILNFSDAECGTLLSSSHSFASTTRGRLNQTLFHGKDSSSEFYYNISCLTKSTYHKINKQDNA